jgi:hypothetical protein
MPDQSISDSGESPSARFIFGPFGRGYRLDKKQKWVAEGIGAGFAMPAVVLIVLLKLRMVSPLYGVGGSLAAFALGFMALKVYVVVAGVPSVDRPFIEKLLAHVDRAPHVAIFGLPISAGVLVLAYCILLTSDAALSLSQRGEMLLLVGLCAFFVLTLVFSLCIKWKLATRRPDDLRL